MFTAKKTIIITGASSGLGRALAINYSRSDSNCRLFLFARDVNKLTLVQDICNNNGAKATIISADVRNKQLMAEHIKDIISKYGVDIVIACAGVSAGTLGGMETAQQIDEIFATNFNGVQNTILPVIPHMIRQGYGNIVLISSLAGLIGLSSAPSYSASKSAVRVFGQALRGYLKKFGVGVSVVIPGYIKTPMTEVNNFPMPFMISPEKAAEKVIRGIEKDKATIAFPLIMYWLTKSLNLLPDFAFDYINSKLPGKPAFDKSNM